jgi:RNA polymerase sigma factor (sigma-70 family)
MSGARQTQPRAEGADDASILARVADGDVAALGTLYDRYAPVLLRYARRIDRNDAEDVVQTVFLRVMRIAPSFRSEASSARPWLFAITTRVLQERTRALRRACAAMLRLSGDSKRSHTSGVDIRHDMQHGLLQLSVAKRTVLVLAEVEGFTCQEIATMLDVPIGTVWTRLHHARREMRRYQDEAPQ